MAASHPTETELAVWAAQVNEQLQALASGPAGVAFRGVAPPDPAASAPEQRALIEKITDQPFETFWQKYLRHLRRDLCLPGGMLYQQWERFKSLEDKSVLKIGYGVLVGMGIPTASLGPVVVAATVFFLNVAAKVGVDAICEGCRQEEAHGPNETKPDEQSQNH